MKRILFFHFICFLFLSPLALAEEYKFDPSEIEKKPYHLGGYGEFRPALSGLDKDSSLYKLRFYNRDEGQTLEEYNFRLQLEGSYEKGIARLFIRANQDLNNTYLGWSSDGTLYEGFLSLKPSNSLIMDFGKRALKWGKGYAWNPVAFIDRPKDPNDPEQALEGFWAASADYIKSFSGALKTLSFTPVFLPVYEHINDDFGEKYKLNFAGKLYLLFYDTDIDVIVFTGGSRTTRYGTDFSRNISSNLEIHGELAWIEGFQKRYTDREGNILNSEYDTLSYLLGIRYLTKTDTTYILEYYRNGTGYSKSEMGDYFSFINKGYEAYLSTGNDTPLKKASNLSEGSFGRINPMRDYLYLRISQKEPWDILYFTPAITAIVNLQDQSFTLTPELLYTGVTNLELRLGTTLISGRGDSEFGEKPNHFRIELRVRYYF